MKTAAFRLLYFCMAWSTLSGCRNLRDKPLSQDAATTGTGGRRGDAGVDKGAGPDRPQSMSDASNVVVNGKQGNGKACGADVDCQSGFCRDGVCCNEACDGTCKACAGTYTEAADGVCANVVLGASSRGACHDETTTKPCGQDGTCDGAGQCKAVVAGQSCADATCTDANTFQPAAVCDGAGACVVGAKMDCGTSPCATTGCAKPCMAMTDCAAGQYCANETCKVKKSPGTNCAAASECVSGFCSPDQVCCDKACTGACTACVKANTGQSDGTCAPAHAGQDPHNDCDMEAATSCGKDGTCDGKGGCEPYASGTLCGAGTCSGSMFTPGKTCNDSGMCSGTGTPTDCGPNACTTGGCKTACKLDGDCGSTGYCDQAAPPQCASKKSNGSPCGGGGECTSAACVENVCCNTACNGTCVSCSSAKTGGTNGTCGFIKARTPDSRCTGSNNSTCGQDGNCDGSGNCEKWPTSTVCAAASCSSGNYLAPRMCSGQGVCNPATQTACGGAVCDATTGCRTSCSTGADCIGNNYCDTSTKACTPLKANGASCGTDGKQCTSGFCVDGVCCNTGACSGQCQSCSTGACKSVTTPRMACPGTGTCAGYCDGTNSACTFKGTSVVCSPATCQSQTTAQLAATCSGSGSCSTPATMPCQGGGVCSGAGVCGCPSSQTSCGGTCVSTNTNAHCGGCNACSAAQPVCVSGSCKQCASNTDCNAGYVCSHNSCVCDTSNLLVNGNFDKSLNLSSWMLNDPTNTIWSTEDVGGSSSSGSVLLNGIDGSIYQCYKMAHPGVTYTFQVSYKGSAGNGVGCQVTANGDTGCLDGIFPLLIDYFDTSDGLGWQSATKMALAPAGTESISVTCSFNGNLDRVSLTPSCP